MHEVLLDTHAKAPELTVNVSVYVMNAMFMLIANILVIMFSVKNEWSYDLLRYPSH